MPGTAARARARAASSDAAGAARNDRDGDGDGDGDATLSTRIAVSCSPRQRSAARSASVLTEPVAPTTIAHSAVTTPITLCRSSHMIGRLLRTRTVPKRNFRLYGK